MEKVHILIAPFNTGDSTPVDTDEDTTTQDGLLVDSWILYAALGGLVLFVLILVLVLLLGILAGANVIMPNLSPPGVREKYLLYDNKLCTGTEAAESLDRLKAQMEKIGYRIAVSRGDSLNM